MDEPTTEDEAIFSIVSRLAGVVGDSDMISDDEFERLSEAYKSRISDPWGERKEFEVVAHCLRCVVVQGMIRCNLLGNGSPAVDAKNVLDVAMILYRDPELVRWLDKTFIQEEINKRMNSLRLAEHDRERFRFLAAQILHMRIHTIIALKLIALNGGT
jgi:hypothetical protein